MDVVCELSPAQRIVYRLLTPLITGAGLFVPLFLIFMNPLRDSDAPAWMSHLLVRLAISAFILGYMVWLTLRVGEVPSWVGLEKGSLRIRSLWGRTSNRPLSEIHEVKLMRMGNQLLGARVRFKDGVRLVLEGRLGPGFGAILDEA